MATDAEIRAEGFYAVPDRRFLQNEFQLPTNTPTEEVTESFGIPYTNVFTNSGQSGGGMGGGKFGNQDMSDYKDFNMPGFDDPVRGFKNTSTGMYQDKDGLNIQNLGMGSFGMAGILEKAFGLKDEDDPPKYPGYFTDNKFGTLLKNPGAFRQYYARQDKAKQDKIQKNSIAAIQGRIDKEYGDSGGGSFNKTNDPTGSKERGFNMHGDKKMAEGGRAGYFFGGRVNYKVGGRTDAGVNRTTASKVGVGQINESGQKVSGGNYNNSGNDGGTKPTFYNNNDQETITTDFIRKNPNLTVDYTDPKNYASIYGKIGFENILDNDDITAAGNVTGEIGPINYDTNFTDQGITGTNLTAGNFNANLSPDMQVQSIGYNNNINGINYGVNTNFDNTMFTAGVNFKNGGLASIL